MGSNPDVYRSHRWKQLRKRVLAEEPLCWICGLPWDGDAQPKSRYSPAIDHVIPLAAGGHPYSRSNVRAAHTGCNSSKKDKTEGYTTTGAGDRGAPPPPHPPSPRSRRW